MPCSRPNGLALAVRASRAINSITAITWFGDISVFPAFGLPRSVADEPPGEPTTAPVLSPPECAGHCGRVPSNEAEQAELT